MRPPIEQIGQREMQYQAVYLYEADEGRQEMWSDEAAEDIRNLCEYVRLLEKVAEAAKKRYCNRGGTYGTDLYWQDKLDAALAALPPLEKEGRS